MRESGRFEQRHERGPRWQEVAVLALTTNERHQTTERLKVLVDEAILCQRYIAYIDALLKRPDITISDGIKLNFTNVAQQMRAYHREVRHHLRPAPDASQALQQIVPDEAAAHHIALSEPEDSLTETDNIQRIGGAMVETHHPQVFSISDSHVTTAYMLKWLAEEHGQPLQSVGVLSFDHHTDLGPVRGVAKKENVMAHVLHNSGVGAVAVLGYEQMFSPPMITVSTRQRVDCITGTDLYRDGHPDVERFREQMIPILADWKQRGITSVYTSVDLDGLRLPEQLYTATDYNPLDNIRWLLDVPQKSPIRKRFDQGVDGLSTSQANESVDWLNNVLTANQLSAYHGIPASWVTRAMRLAKEDFGLQLGIDRPDSTQRVIGDIVEYTPPDYQNRTARISRALLGSMSTVAQVR